MKTLAAAIIPLLLLVGCVVPKEYYLAQLKLLEMQLEEQRAEKEQQQRSTPGREIIKHSWTDVAGMAHSVVVHEPTPIIINQAPKQERPLTLPHPYEPLFKFYDRSLDTVERFVPLFFRRDGDSRGDSYVLGDGASFSQYSDSSTTNTKDNDYSTRTNIP